MNDDPIMCGIKIHFKLIKEDEEEVFVLLGSDKRFNVMWMLKFDDEVCFYGDLMKR